MRKDCKKDYGGDDLIESTLSNIAIILFMHLTINMIHHYAPRFSKLTLNFMIVLVASFSIICMFYLPVRFGDYFLDLRMIPLIFFALMRGWKLAIPILLITSLWRLLMGGPGMMPGIVFGMILPTLFALLFYHGEKPHYFFARTFFVVTIAWAISDLPTLFYFQMEWDENLLFLVKRYLSVLIGSFTLYIFIINSIKQVDLKNKLRHYAEYDQLTGLFNKRKFVEEVEKRRKYTNGYLALLDLDHFKKINDVYGHLTGDHVLKEVANLLKEKQNQNVFFARFGGEEFIAYYEGERNQDVIAYFEDIRKKLERKSFYTFNGTKIPKVTISIGLKKLNRNNDLFTEFDLTDQYLYCAKENGRNRVCSEEYEPETVSEYIKKGEDRYA